MLLLHKPPPKTLTGWAWFLHEWVFLSPGPWGRPDPQHKPQLPPYNSWLFLLTCLPASTAGVQLLQLITKESFPVHAVAITTRSTSGRAVCPTGTAGAVWWGWRALPQAPALPMTQGEGGCLADMWGSLSWEGITLLLLPSEKDVSNKKRLCIL